MIGHHHLSPSLSISYFTMPTFCCSSSSSSLVNAIQIKGLPSPLLSRQGKGNFNVSGSFKFPNRSCCRKYRWIGARAALSHLEPSVDAVILPQPFNGMPPNLVINILENSRAVGEYTQRLVVLADLDPASAKLAIAVVGPILSAFSFLFILRIIMSWYPRLPVGKFPYVLAYAPTEPILVPTRKLIPPLGGVDVTPVVWFGLLSFLNEILVGPQGLLILLSQQV